MFNRFFNQLPKEKLILKLLSLLPPGTKEKQDFYQQLYRKALTGMNFGNGGNFAESGELYVFQFVKEFTKGQQIIIFDVGANIDSRTYFQDFWYLLKDRFTIYRIVKDGLVEIKAYTESLEVFSTINYLAVKK